MRGVSVTPVQTPKFPEANRLLTDVPDTDEDMDDVSEFSKSENESDMATENMEVSAA